MNNPDLQKWLLAPDGIATRLRALRGTTTGNTFATTAGMRASKLSKLELAQQTPTAADIHAIVTAAGQPAAVADELVTKLAEMPTAAAEARINRLGQAAAQKRLNQTLAGADRLQTLELTHLPRPLQTAEYASVVLKAAAAAAGTKPEPDAARILVEAGTLIRDPRRVLQAVIWEPLLHWQPLPAADMRTQLQALLDAAALPNVDLRILPLHHTGSVLPSAGFTLAADGGYTDTLEGATILSGKRLAGHAALMADLWEAAVAGPSAEGLIRAAIARTRNVQPVQFTANPHA